MREEVVARRRVPDGGPFRWAELGPVPDLYFEDELFLDGRVYPSLTRPDALRYYAFRLGETVEADGRRYLDLAVIPRRGGLLAGRVRVVDSLLVVAEADLRTDGSVSAGPVDAFDAAYRWRYGPAPAGPAPGRLGLAAPPVRPVGLGDRQPARLPRAPGPLPPDDGAGPGPARGPGRGGRARPPLAEPARRLRRATPIFRTGRNALPLDSLETAAWESDRVRRSSLADLLKRQEGIGISFGGLAGLFGGALSADVEGEDDD